MGLSHEHVEPKILAKIQIYILPRAELLFTLCSEIPCTNIFCHLGKEKQINGIPILSIVTPLSSDPTKSICFNMLFLF
jgi:hypothetical protein